MSNQVILVDKNDNEVGLEEKITAHKKKLLHRAFSIFLFNKSSEILLQKRAPNKYHSGNLWTNTCCSHPLPSISLLESAKKRLVEEMGIEAELKKIFVYSPAIQASGKFCNLISDGGPKGFKPNSLKGLIELKNKTKIGSTAKSANKINIK